MPTGRCCVQLVLSCQSIQMMKDAEGNHLMTQLKTRLNKSVKWSSQGDIMVLRKENKIT